MQTSMATQALSHYGADTSYVEWSWGVCGDAEAGVVGWTIGATGVIHYSTHPYTRAMGWGRLSFSSECFAKMKLYAGADSVPRSKVKGAKATWR